MSVKSSGHMKEMETLFLVAEILERKDLRLDQALLAVVAELPNGFQPPEHCRVRITLLGEVRESRGFEWRPGALVAPIPLPGEPSGILEVVQLGGGGPFTLEQKKLVDQTAHKLAQFAEAQRRHEQLKWRSFFGRPLLAGGHRPEWLTVLELLPEMDTNLHKRMLRRLINHLTQLGVPDMQEVIREFSQGDAGGTGYAGANAPLPRLDLAVLERVFARVIQVASITLEEGQLNQLIKQWVRQDTFGFLALATERRDISLAELGEVLDRFCKETEAGQPVLTHADDQAVRVSLATRLLTAHSPFIRIAREHLSIHAFGRILGHVLGPAQGLGKLGGKACGLILAESILEQAGDPLLAEVRVPASWYLTSDGICSFIRVNALEDVWSTKYNPIEAVRRDFPEIEEIFRDSFFPSELSRQLEAVLEDLGDAPLAVRPSSLLEDAEGSAFAHIYRGAFLANGGSREDRLQALQAAITEAYASAFGPEGIAYRARHGLLDFNEELAILIQPLVGTRAGGHFHPLWSGIAVQGPDGIRLTPGLGTRLAAPAGAAEATLDALNLATGAIEALPCPPDLVEPPFLRLLAQALLDRLEAAMGLPLEIEFAHDGRALHLLQCRVRSAPLVPSAFQLS